MTEPHITISIKRNVAVVSVVAVLVLAALYYYYFYVKVHAPSPDDVVKVIVAPVRLLEEFQNTFQSLGVTGLILVDKDGNLRAITSNGTPIDLCGAGSEIDKSGQPSCKLATTSKALVSYLSGEGTCGRCLAGGYLRSCHKNNHKWYCHGGGHHYCASTCQ
jgi:hypothetical protein